MENEINQVNQNNDLLLQDKKLYIKKWVGLFFVLIVVLGVLYFFYNNKNVKEEEKIIPKIIKTTDTGAIVNGFSKNYILFSDAKIINSKILNDDSDNKTIVTTSVTYITKTELGEVIKKYDEYYKNNQYLVSRKEIVDNKTIIYSVKGKDSVSTVIYKDQNDTKVEVYLTTNETI